MQQSLCLEFSVTENSESMKTKNDKQKFRLQQQFKMLSRSLDTGLESFSPLVNGPVNDSQFAVSQDLNLSMLQFSHATHWLLMVLLLPWKLYRWHSARIKLFKYNQSAIKCWSILWKINHDGPVLMKLCQPVFRSPFFFEARCIYCKAVSMYQKWRLQVKDFTN